MFGITVITPSTVEPVSLSDMKEFSRVDGDDPAHETTLNTLIGAATEHIQQATGRQFVQATFDLTLDGFPVSLPIYVPRSPLASVTSIKYRDLNSVEQTLDPDDYIVHADRQPGLIEPATSWPATAIREDAVTVRFVAGYAAGGSPSDPAANVPARAKTAIMQLASHWFEHREAVYVGASAVEVPLHVGRLINGLKVWR